MQGLFYMYHGKTQSQASEVFRGRVLDAYSDQNGDRDSALGLEPRTLALKELFKQLLLKMLG